MIDTHAHLDFPEFDKDREEVITRFFENGPADAKAMAGKGKAIINVGVDLERSKKSIGLAETHDNIFASVGIHPDFFSKAEEEFPISNLAYRQTGFQFPKKSQISNPKFQNLFNGLRELAKHKKVVAIGETGLDYFSHTNETITDAQKGNQKAGFIAQINLAKELGLPVIVHCRDAWHDLYEIISKVRLFPPPHRRIPQGQTFFVLHCYSGEGKDTEKFLELPNIYFSFSGNITYPKPVDRAKRLADAIRIIGLDRIMLDSDSPFLAPQSLRGKRNEPINVSDIAAKIAEIKGISDREVELQTDKNAISFFPLDKFKLSE